MGIHPIIFVIGCVCLLLCAAGYFLTAWPMYCIARRREIEKAWLAWLPVGNYWILGSISDDYHFNVHYTTKSSRKVLLCLSVMTGVFALLLLLCSFVVIQSVLDIDADQLQQHGHYIDFWAPVRENLKTMLWVYVLAFVVACIHVVVKYFALFRVYQSCAPGSSVLMLILSILSGICIPVCLLCVYKQDAGYQRKGKSFTA